MVEIYLELIKENNRYYVGYFNAGELIERKSGLGLKIAIQLAILNELATLSEKISKMASDIQESKNS